MGGLRGPEGPAAKEERTMKHAEMGLILPVSSGVRDGTVRDAVWSLEGPRRRRIPPPSRGLPGAHRPDSLPEQAAEARLLRLRLLLDGLAAPRQVGRVGLRQPPREFRLACGVSPRCGEVGPLERVGGLVVQLLVAVGVADVPPAFGPDRVVLEPVGRDGGRVPRRLRGRSAAARCCGPRRASAAACRTGRTASGRR